MDEMFPSSQKLENLQFQLYLLKEHSINLASDLWHSSKMIECKQMVKELLVWVLRIAEHGHNVLITVINPRNLYNNACQLIQNETYRRHLYYGCFGFVLGYTIASLVRKTPTYLSTMQAAVCIDYGGPDSVTVLDDIPTPRMIESDDILIQVKASSISITDVQICHGYGKRTRRLLCHYFTNNYNSSGEFPIILGRSCSGIVLEIGRNVHRFEIGDEVYAYSPYWAPGMTAQIIVVKDFRVARKPKRIGFESAAGLPYYGCLALDVLKQQKTEHIRDKNILVCNGCSPSGCVLIQYCTMLGASVTATTNESKSAPVPLKLGATDVIILHEQFKTKQLEKELELRNRFDLIFVTDDSVSKRELQPFCSNVVTVGNINQSKASWIYVRCKSLLKTFFGCSLQLDDVDDARMSYDQLEFLSELVDHRNLQSVIDKVFRLYDIELALEHVQSTESIGSTIVTFRD